MPRDANTNFSRFAALAGIINFSMAAGACLARQEYWSAAFAGAFVVLMGAILGGFLYVRDEK